MAPLPDTSRLAQRSPVGREMSHDSRPAATGALKMMCRSSSSGGFVEASAVQLADGSKPTEAPTAKTTKARPRRADIQGLRAVLMLQVMLFHAWFIGSPIGVDAFIMISAYLMTASFIRRTDAGNRPGILDRWATTFKRLLPPLALVVVLTLFASVLILPANRWQSVVDQAFASLTYWQNWLLAHISVDYFAEDHALSSPLQHLWSMSMQGQMFLAWPVIMVLLALVAKAFDWSARKAIFLGFSGITALSLTWVLTTPMTGSAYFDTRARIWEFALGSAIAALSTKLKLKPKWARLVAGIALAVLLVYCLVSIGSYPGPMAAVPLLATSAILLFSKDGVGAGRILSWKPLVALGNMSYAVYLVHWPLFVLYLAAVRRENLNIVEGLVLMALSVGLSYLLTRFVDDPIRTLPWANTVGRKSQIVGVTLWVSLTAVFTVQTGIWQTATAQASVPEQEGTVFTAEPIPPDPSKTNSEAEPDPEPEPLPALDGYPGAGAMIYPGPFAFSGEPIPGPLTLDNEWVMYEGRCSDPARQVLYQYPKTGCHAHGNPDAPSRIFVAGSSHAEQVLMPAARLFADENDFYVEASLKAGCPWSMPDPNTSSDCQGHNQVVLQYVKDQSFDYVLLIVTATTADSPEERLGYDVETLIREITATGATVIGIRDNLRTYTNLFECASSQDSAVAYGGCLLERGKYFASDDLVAPLLDIPNFYYVDVMDLYCDGEVCPTIAGNVQIYLDTNHVTQSYGNTMAPIIMQRTLEKLSEDSSTNSRAHG